MANVEHSTLTGASLHEPKGVAAASSGQVYVANGAGTGVWTSISTSINPFGTQLLHVRDRVSSGTAAQTFSSGNAWNQRRLQTVATNEISGATLTSNQISLPVGTYWIDARSAIRIGGTGGSDGTEYRASLRLRNITAGSTLVLGENVNSKQFFDGLAGLSFWYSTSIPLVGRFTLGGTTTIELQTWVNHTGIVTGGRPTTTGEDEVYTDVMIWKLS